MKISSIKQHRGFTLIELLVVIGILAVLLAITLIAINPARQFALANNTQRSSDVNAILNAVGQYAVDNNGNLDDIGIPVGTGSAQVIGSGGGQVNFCPSIVPTYMAALPVDPVEGTWEDCSNYNTAYRIYQSASDSRVTVYAPFAELEETISVTR